MMNSRKHIVLLSIICFLISLCQPAFFKSVNSREFTHGLTVFFLGWIGIFKGDLLSIGWLANPALILSWINYMKFNVSFNCSLCPFFFGIFFFIYDFFTKEVHFSNYNIGVCFWVLSILIMFVANLYILKIKNKGVNKTNLREG